MTADLDLSPEAVERLAAMLDRASGSPVLRSVYLNTRDAEWCAVTAASTLRALAAENARLRAERDAAWQPGAEAMQKVAARTAVATPATRSDTAGFVWHDGFTSGCLHAADAIRALPLPGQPKEGEN